ncbi:AraC family transcriptional regulator [Cognatiyoonia sp. IB215182]|uniref:AraC family transcriptional regulator n=1 Tax=Cognatiyoonia sp. IB215182 TaxID=3097353 RepID=UPI002A12622A|nr:AraC family transcriptional regulator [Cognatiyoonia sp. IB215182]MDX8350865.1 AraC family transcriptional regulator [Cognatiyoonia sp. IB215182]
MTQTFDVPIAGLPVTIAPTLEHEFAFTGLRALALPPGETEVNYVMQPHILNVCLPRVKALWAVNSDRLRPDEVAPSTSFWAPARTELKIVAKNQGWGLLLEVGPDRLEALLPDTASVAPEATGYRPAPVSALLAHQLINHMRFGTPDRLFVEGMSLAILACGLNLARSGSEENSAAVGSADLRIARAIDYIEAHLGDDLSIATIASAAGMSPSWFQSAFRAATGRPVFAYVRERRLVRARHHLADHRLSLTQIAHTCGFSSHSHMTRLFTAHYGASPRDMR